MKNCDVLVTKDHRVFINGHEVGAVLSLEVRQDANEPTRLTIELMPTSMVYGNPPQSTFSPEVSDPNARVDIDAAIQRAKDRVGRGKNVTGP